MIRTGSRAVLESFTHRFPRSGIFSSVGTCFRSRFLWNPARVARRRTRTVDGADVRAVEGRPGSTAFSVHRGTSSLFVAGRRRNSLGRGGFRLTRTTPRGGRPPAGPEAHSFARREPSETRAASRDHGGRAEGEQGPDAGEGASRAPRGRGRGRRAARGPGPWDPRAFFRAERAERRSRSPPTDANDAGERRKGPREGAREGARAARERREARGTPSATNPSRGRVASRTASRPRIRAAPGKIAPTAPNLSAHRAHGVRRFYFTARFHRFDSSRPVRPTNADDARPEPTPPRRVSPPPPRPPPPPSPRRLRLRTLPRRARARCRSRTRRRPTRRRTRRRPQTNTADRARPPRDRRRRSSPPTRPRPRDRCDRPRDRDRDPRLSISRARAGR